MTTPTIKRNDPCPCGSGKKYKKCCMGKVGAAAAAPAKAAARKPDPQELRRQAIAAHRAGRFEQAEALYRQVLAKQPRDAPIVYNVGVVQKDLGRTEEAVATLRRAIKLDDKQAGYHATLADAAYTLGEMDESLRAAKRAVALDPKNAHGHRLIALWHERTNELDEAIAAIERAAACDPDNDNIRIIRASFLQRQGDFEGARKILEDVIETTTFDEYRFRALRVLGQVLAKRGDYDASFAALERGGELWADCPPALRFDRDAPFALVDSYRRGFTPALLGRWDPADAPDDPGPPIFLVGFPRSGTTMTEQILNANPNVRTSDEIEFIRSMKRYLGELVGPAEVPVMLERLDVDGARTLRARYWDDVRDEVGIGPSRLFVDKNPLNIIDLGLINVVFPDAKVIVVIRDPRDVCLSCFTQRFNLNESMVNFLRWERTAELYAAVMGLWREQREMLTLDITEMKYEDMVRDLPGESRRVFDAVGIPWTEDEVLRFHEKAATRLISTPSYEAVTKKINTGAIGRWKNYAKHYAPVEEMLRPFVEAFGYVADR